MAQFTALQYHTSAYNSAMSLNQNVTIQYSTLRMKNKITSKSKQKKLAYFVNLGLGIAQQLSLPIVFVEAHLNVLPFTSPFNVSSLKPRL